ERPQPAPNGHRGRLHPRFRRRAGYASAVRGATRIRAASPSLNPQASLFVLCPLAALVKALGRQAFACPVVVEAGRLVAAQSPGHGPPGGRPSGTPQRPPQPPGYRPAHLPHRQRRRMFFFPPRAPASGTTATPYTPPPY